MPVTMFRIKMSNVYEVSAISTGVRFRPVSGMSSTNKARLGIVYKKPAAQITGL